MTTITKNKGVLFYVMQSPKPRTFWCSYECESCTVS